MDVDIVEKSGFEDTPFVRAAFCAHVMSSTFRALHIPDAAKEHIKPNGDPIRSLGAVIHDHVTSLVNMILDYEPESDNAGFVKQMKDTFNRMLVNCMEEMEKDFSGEMRSFIEGNFKAMLAMLCSPN